MIAKSDSWKNMSLTIDSESFQFEFACDTGKFFWGYKFRVVATGENVTYCNMEYGRKYVIFEREAREF